MRIIGLTGGIASGKSTVAQMLRERGAALIDADAVYHALITPSQDGTPSDLAQRIAARFPGVLTADGRVDRTALRERVFADAHERRALEHITHPAVAAAVAERAQQLAAAGASEMIYDVPLLFERGLEAGMHGVIVVWVPEACQVERLQQREGISAAEARRRIATQMPLDDKRRRATWVIDNSGSRAATRAQVDALWRRIHAAHSRGV